ncbi:hypothetical protein LJC55_03185 [Eubacteriales bacterium OttesenSCG-928-N14]|nr:hypothetical protein [Eubacteriales bacterium OttesenSCG-928-N14]
MNNRQKGCFALACLLLCSIFSFLPITAEASSTLTVAVTANPQTMSGPGNAEIAINIVNNMSEDVTITSIVGPGINETGMSKSLPAGTGLNEPYTTTYSVKEADFGKALSYVVTYTDSGGNVKTVTGTVTITRISQEAKMEWSATPSKTAVPAGTKITMTYKVSNTGTAPMTNVTITDPLAGGMVKTWNTISAGQTETATKEITINQTSKSEASITYTANGTQRSDKASAKTITVATPTLELSAKADTTTVDKGGKVTFEITLKSTTAADIENIKIVDEIGTEIRSSASVVGNKTASFKYEMTLEASRNVVFSATYSNGTSNVTAKTETIAISVTGENPNKLEVTATSDKASIELPGEVVFTIIVKNTSGATLNNLKVSSDKFGDIETIPTLANGATTEVKATKTLEEAGNFIFVVTGKDAANVDISVASAPVVVADANALGTPTPEPPRDGDTLGTLFIIMIVIIVLIVLAGIALAVLMINERRKNGPKGKGPKGGPGGGGKGGNNRKRGNGSRRVDLYEDDELSGAPLYASAGGAYAMEEDDLSPYGAQTYDDIDGMPYDDMDADMKIVGENVTLGQTTEFSLPKEMESEYATTTQFEPVGEEDALHLHSARQMEEEAAAAAYAEQDSPLPPRRHAPIEEERTPRRRPPHGDDGLQERTPRRRRPAEDAQEELRPRRRPAEDALDDAEPRPRRRPVADRFEEPEDDFAPRQHRERPALDDDDDDDFAPRRRRRE